MNSADLNRLIEPLIVRSFLSTHTASFRDRAAQYVLKRLGVNSIERTHRTLNPHSQKLTRLADSKVSQFFIRHPEGQGIEVNCGLSTRFHRISDLSSWPRFSWQIISQPEVDDCLKFAFPELDNFRTMASQTPETSWTKYVGWGEANALIVLMAEARPLTDSQLESTLNSLLSFSLNNLRYLQVLLFHQQATLKPLIDRYPSLILRDETLSGSRQNIIQRALRALTPTTQTATTTLSHIEVNPPRGITA